MSLFGQPSKLALVVAALIAASWLLLWAPGAEAASKQRGAVLVKDINPGKSSSTGGGYPTDVFAHVAGTLFFAAGDRRHGNELWRSDGTRRGTRMVKDIRPGPRPCATSKPVCRGQGASSDPSQLTVVGKTLYFTADDGIHGRELWRSDGTSRGTRLVKDSTPGTGPSKFSSEPRGLTDVAGTLFFSVSERGNSQLWRSDGTEAGTTMLKEGPGSIGERTAVGGTLYFAAEAAEGSSWRSGLWRSDGTASGTVLVKTGILGGLTDFGGTLFFSGHDGTRYGLWRSDGTEAGTILVKEGVPASGPTAVGRILYFTTYDPSDSWLWRSDGTGAGTTPITSVGPTPEGDALWPQLTNVGGTLYFVRNGPPPGYSGATLMRTDGTPSGTRELRRGIIPRQLTAVGKTLYFEGYDKRHANELWRSDGTPRGTRLVRDINRGERSSGLFDLTATGKTLFFGASDGVHGRELWRAGAKPCKKAKGKCKKR
jgi:ELWxxDGT repeat protein